MATITALPPGSNSKRNGEWSVPRSGVNIAPAYPFLKGQMAVVIDAFETPVKRPIPGALVRLTFSSDCTIIAMAQIPKARLLPR